MAKILHGPIVSDARGKVGDTVYSKGRGGKFARALRMSPPVTGAADQVYRVPGAGGNASFGKVDLTKSAAVSGPLPVSFGGTGTATPALVAGANITITGSWPNHTVNLSSPLAGTITIGNGTGLQQIILHGGVGFNQYLGYFIATLPRWTLTTDAAAESGSNAGTNLNFVSYSDAGAPLAQVFFMQRSNGRVGFNTTQPKSKVHIHSGAASEFPVGGTYTGSSLFLSGSSQGYGLWFGVSDTGRPWLQSGRSDAATYYDLVMQYQGGNVGIGSNAPKSKLHVVGLPIYANNAAATAAGLTAGAFYRTGADPDPVCVVH